VGFEGNSTNPKPWKKIVEADISKGHAARCDEMLKRGRAEGVVNRGGEGD